MMKTLRLKNTQQRIALSNFFSSETRDKLVVSSSADCLEIQIDDSELAPSALNQLELHLRYYDLFKWYSDGVDDVVYFEVPEQFDSIIADFGKLTREMDYDVLAPVEARGFVLAGILSSKLKMPILQVRKSHFQNYRFESGQNGDEKLTLYIEKS